MVKGKKKRQFKPHNLFFLTWKKFLAIIVGWFLAVLFHNIFYFITGTEEPVFFIIAAILLPLYIVSCTLYTLIYMILDISSQVPRKKRPKKRKKIEIKKKKQKIKKTKNKTFKKEETSLS
jgi:predicted membrane protein